uniref:Uncharacterized protein n=1 Tax=Anabas testudineus TaxID=64144 RepID=A0A7N6B999_ANATE
MLDVFGGRHRTLYQYLKDLICIYRGCQNIKLHCSLQGMLDLFFQPLALCSFSLTNGQKCIQCYSNKWKCNTVLCFLCSFYTKLTHCVDNWANSSWCKGHGFLKDEVFMRVHQEYFSLCGYIHDPPLATLMMLIVPPIIATWASKGLPCCPVSAGCVIRY